MMNSMITKIVCFISKITDIFPIGGGAVGAATQINNINTNLLDTAWTFPWHTCLTAIVVAAIGAIVGYLFKLGFDLLFKKFKNKHGI